MWSYEGVMWPTPLYNSHLNWILEPVPHPSRDHCDLTSPAPSRDHGIPTAARKIRRPRARPVRFRGRYGRVGERRGRLGQQPIIILLPRRLEGRDSVSQQPIRIRHLREAGRETQPGSTTNHNSPPREAGNQPGISRSTGSEMRTPVEHPLTFLRPQHPQHPRLTANQNSGRRFDPDHSESGRLFKPARYSILQDSTFRSHRDSFSGSPVGHLSRNISLTDPKREERIAGGLRPGLVLPHPRAACPDTRIELDTAPLEAAAVSRAERPPTAVDIPETGRLEATRRPELSPKRGSRSPKHHSRKRPRNRSSALYLPKKRSPHPGHWCE